MALASHRFHSTRLILVTDPWAAGSAAAAAVIAHGVLVRVNEPSPLPRRRGAPGLPGSPGQGLIGQVPVTKSPWDDFILGG